MRKGLAKKLLSLALIGAMSVSGLPATAKAVTGETVKGLPETVQMAPITNNLRENDFNKDWKFYLGTNNSAMNTGFDDSSWQKVNLPHDFSITQNFTTSGEAESGFLPGGTGWYRKKFVLPSDLAGKRIVLDFDGVYKDSYVYINGSKVGENHYGYNNFAIDITDQVICDGVTENVIAVKAENQLPSSRWYSGSGIYRDVTMVITEDVHVAHDGVYVTTPDIASGKGTVNAVVEVQNDSASAANVSLRVSVYEKGGTEVVAAAVSDAVSVNAGQTSKITVTPVVSSPKLWSTEEANQYTIVTEVVKDGTVVDTVTDDFGFRWFEFVSGTGFKLNGKNVKLDGVCMHHDQGALGAVANYDAMYRQVSTMKEMGVNAIRITHNPGAEIFVDICNDLGILVVEEFFDGWVDPKNGNSYDFSQYFEVAMGKSGLLNGTSSMTWAEYVVNSVVRRDRNDASIILWSICNEVQEGTNWANVSRYATIAGNIINWVKANDTTRPCTSGDNNRGGDSRLVNVLNTLRNNGGIVGFNYANDVSTLSNLASSYGGVILNSETSSAINSRGIYTTQASASNADGKYHLTSYDTSNVGWGCTAAQSIYNTYSLDSVAGEFVWTGFDYIGEPTPWNGTGTGSASGNGAIPNSSYFGIVETTGFPKDTYYLYRSQWNEKANTLHLVTAWDSDNYMTTSGKTPVVVYSNAPKVELYRGTELVGTATRTANTSKAGHTYYTYTVTSNNTSVCTAQNGSGSTALYATFNVAYQAGTISAKAYDANGNEITSSCQGNHSVSTPGTVTKLVIDESQIPGVIDADGYSLAYIPVDVTDANGILDTTATTNINVTITGNGQIVGVDNGDQATTSKYQQSSVLGSDRMSASIKAYAGKALIIVRSTEEAGSFTVNVSASGMTGDSVTVYTSSNTTDSAEVALSSYTMVRDYSVKAGTSPVLETEATGQMSDGNSVSGTISWESIPAATYQTAGDYVISGTLTMAGQTIPVTARLHVIDNVIAMRNVSTAVLPGQVPTLPDTVVGVLADGTLSGEFSVTWDSVTANDFDTISEVVVVNGTATVLGTETLPVTASVRVAEPIQTESTNVAPQSSELTQDIEAGKQSDNLSSIKNGTLKPGDNTSERWSNWGNRTTSETATLTFRWDTAQSLGSANLYYYYDNCAVKPASVKFEYSLDGINYQTVESTETLTETYDLGASYTYTFAKPVNPISLRVILTQQSGTTGNNCVALTEVELMTYGVTMAMNSSADLSGILVDGAAITDFDASTLEYTAIGSAVTAETTVNAGITILPEYEGVVRILTISEDGSTVKTYEVTCQEAVCEHIHTTLTGKKTATCIAKGYTGDLVCDDCNAVVETGTEIPTTDHTWNSGAVTTKPTVEAEGVMTYTCNVCHTTRTEAIPKLEPAVEKEIPAAEVSATVGSSSKKIVLNGKFVDYENMDKYCEVTAHGFVYYSTARLGSRTLTVNTSGRTRVNKTTYEADGSFSYTMTAASTSTRYTVRAFLEYVDENGKKKYAYSSPIIVSYNSLK